MVHKLIAFLLFCLPCSLTAQPRVLDEIVAIVGDNYILRSDVDKEYETLREQMGEENMGDSFRIEVLDKLIAKKIFLHKAQLDSTVINEDRVDAEMDRKLAYILSHFGGDEERLEDYLGMSIVEFKDKTRQKLKEQLLIDEMENEIMGSVKVTPSEVRKYFHSIPKDSLAPIPAEVEVAQIVIMPKVSETAKEYSKLKADEIRKRLLKGEDFCFLAGTYSDDPGSSGNCGKLGFFKRGKMVPEFEAAAFNLKKDSISKVIESPFGFHIIRQIERRGESVNVQHILISPKIVSSDISKARSRMDSLLQLINNGEMTFSEAAMQFSDDENTKSNGGKITDHSSGNTMLEIGQLDKDTYLAIKDLKPGQMSPSQLVTTPDGKQVFIVHKLITETEPHAPDLERDYLKIQAAALNTKKQKALEDWLQKHKSRYYIKINDRYSDDPRLAHWLKK